MTRKGAVATRGVPSNRFGDLWSALSAVFGWSVICKIVLGDTPICRSIYWSARYIFNAYLMQYVLKMILLRFLSHQNLNYLRIYVYFLGKMPVAQIYFSLSDIFVVVDQCCKLKVQSYSIIFLLTAYILNLILLF